MNNLVYLSRFLTNPDILLLSGDLCNVLKVVFVANAVIIMIIIDEMLAIPGI